MAVMNVPFFNSGRGLLTNRPALIWKNRRYPFKLGSSICCGWTRISSDRQAGNFHLACETWKRAGASHFCLTSLLAPRSPCVLSCAVAKTITCADTGNLRLACFTQREGFYLSNATTSPHGPLTRFRHLEDIVFPWPVWCFNNRLLFIVTVQQYNHSSWPWAQHLTRKQSPCRCVLTTQSGQDTGRKCHE